jgi:mono/diheme cytochrome c family protein
MLPIFLALIALPLTVLLSVHPIHGAAAPGGEQIYRQRCASCHGAKGEGTKLYAKPLTGDRSVAQLAEFISRSMPPGSRNWIGDDARKVAVYIHDAFYSPLARARNKPARIALSRLTVRQYRNAVADLVGSFRAPARPDGGHGLRGEYFRSRRFRAEDRVFERVDPEIRFDFGESTPAPDQFDPHQFSIRWKGGLLAPDTGEYEFILRTEHAARLWINDQSQPLIDAGVKSGGGTEHRASLFLLGGRVYPFRLEFSKAGEGVDNSKRLKDRAVAKASLALEWNPPDRAAEAIPERFLLTGSFPEVFVVATPFPPDDRSAGYERGSSVSKAWDEAATEAALETAAHVAARLRQLSGVADDAPDRETLLRGFSRRFAERAFRRPVTDDAERFFVERQFQQAPDFETAVKRVVLLALKSPRFLYRELGLRAPDSYDAAERLSFGLWDSLPDQELLNAAAAGRLSTREQVIAQAERMVSDPRARSKLREFFMHWLKVDQYPDLSKDPEWFPRFDRAVASDLRTSLELFLERVAWSERSDFRELLLSNSLFLNGRLAQIYGADLAPDAPFQEVPLEAERAGILTHPYLMASFAYLSTTSPIHRGVLIARNFLGRTLRPPPQAFTPLEAELHPNLTTRQRVALQTRPAACASCHGIINPLGFTLEKFDAIGRFQDRENGRPVDASGSYQSSAGKTIRFKGVRDVARFLAGSEEAHAAFVERLFHHLVKQPVRAYGPRAFPDLQRSFKANEFNIRKQIVETVASSALPAGGRKRE